MSRLAPALLILLAGALAAAPAHAASTTVLRGVLSSDSLLAYTEGARVLGSIPDRFTVVYQGTAATIPVLAYNATCTVQPRVKAHWLRGPSGFARTYQGAFLVDASASVAPVVVDYTNVTGNTTVYMADVYIDVEADITVKVIELYTRQRTLDIGDAIDAAFNGSGPVLVADYNVTVLCGDKGNWTWYGRVYTVLSTGGLDVSLTRLAVEAVDATPAGFRVEELGGGVVFQPLYNVTVCVEAAGQPPPSPVPVYVGSTLVEVAAGENRSCGVVGPLPLEPGRSTRLLLPVYSTFFAGTLNASLEAPGLAVAVSPQPGTVTHLGSEGLVEAEMVIPYTAEGWNATGTLSATAVAEGVGPLECTTASLSPGSSGAITCRAQTTSTLPGNHSFKVWLHLQTSSHGEASAERSLGEGSVVEAGSLAQAFSQVYSYAITLLAAGGAVSVALAVLAVLAAEAARLPLLGDPTSLLEAGVLMLAAAVIVSAAAPAITELYGKTLHSIPEFRNYVEPSGEKSPSAIYSHYLGYYDKLFARITRDYGNYVARSIGAISSKMLAVSAAAVAILTTATLLSLFANVGPAAGIMANIGTTILSTVATIMVTVMAMAVAAPLVLVAVALTRAFVFIVSAVALSSFLLGVVMSVLPGRVTQRLGEELLGAGLAFMFILPLLGPTAYAVYSYVVDKTMPMIGGVNTVTNIAFGAVNLVIPVKEMVAMTIFMAASSTGLGMLLASLAYLLSRAGVFAGIGQAFTGIIRF